MPENPAISVLIPWRDREEISRTLAANTHAFQTNNAEVLVINCGGDAGRLRALILASEVANVRELDIPAPRFNKCLALNAGLLQSRAEIVFILDADVILLDQSLSELRGAVSERALATIEWVYESVPSTQRRDVVGDFTASMVNRGVLELVFQDGRRIDHQINRQNPFENARAGRGLLMARKLDLLKIQGYNSGLQTWGWEDDDVLIRLQHAAGIAWLEKGRALHLSHGDQKRVLDQSRGQSSQFNFIKCCRNYNRGVFTGTLLEDAKELQALHPEPVVATAAETSEPSTPIEAQEGRESCGGDGVVTIERDDPRSIPSLGDLLLAAALRRIARAGSRALLAGTGSHLALFQQDFSVITTNSCSYDVIIDDSLASYACCRRHLTAVMEKYAQVLDPRGAILTLEPGIVSGRAEPCWKPTWRDVAEAAEKSGLSLRKSGYGVYLLTRKNDAS